MIFLFLTVAFGAMQKEHLWACDDLEKGSYCMNSQHEMAAGKRTALTAVLQEEKEMSPWDQDMLYHEEKNRNGVETVTG